MLDYNTNHQVLDFLDSDTLRQVSTLNKEYHSCIHIINDKDKLKQEIIEKWKGLDNNKYLLIELLTS